MAAHDIEQSVPADVETEFFLQPLFHFPDSESRKVFPYGADAFQYSVLVDGTFERPSSS